MHAQTDATTTRRSIISGIVAAPLMIASIWVLPVTDTTKATSEQMKAYYDDRDMRFRIAALVLGLAVLGFLAFSAWLAARVRRLEVEYDSLPGLVIGGAVGFAVLQLAAVAAFTAEGHLGKEGASMDVIRGLEEIGHMTWHVSGIPLALYVAAAAVALTASGLCPKWVKISGFIIAPLCFAHGISYFEKAPADATLHSLGLLGFHLAFIWTLAIGISLLRRSRVADTVLQSSAVPA